jgi:hypothetical protein
MSINNGLSAAAAAGALTIVLAGCGPTVTFDSAGKMLSDNKELSASAEMTSSLRTSGAGVTAATNTTFAVKKNAGGGVDVTAGGKTMSFSPADVTSNPSRWAKAGVPTQVAVPVGETTVSALAASDAEYAQVWGYFYQDASERLLGFGAVGNETPVASMPTTATASYVGVAGIVGNSTANPGVNSIEAEWGTERAKQVNGSSEARLSVNFANKTVNGNLSGAVRNVGGVMTSAPALDMTLGTAAIVGNSFTGTVTGQGVDANSTYAGKFFGPAAEEAAGVIDMSAGGGTFLGAGGFHTKKQ